MYTTRCSEQWRHYKSPVPFDRRAAQVMGLVLLAALQRRRRGIHISSMLRPDEVPLNLTLAEIRAARNTSMDDTMNRLEVRARCCKCQRPPKRVGAMLGADVGMLCLLK